VQGSNTLGNAMMFDPINNILLLGSNNTDKIIAYSWSGSVWSPQTTVANQIFTTSYCTNGISAFSTNIGAST
jgi:hypothetical protein